MCHNSPRGGGYNYAHLQRRLRPAYAEKQQNLDSGNREIGQRVRLLGKEGKEKKGKGRGGMGRGGEERGVRGRGGEGTPTSEVPASKCTMAAPWPFSTSKYYSLTKRRRGSKIAGHSMGACDRMRPRQPQVLPGWQPSVALLQAIFLYCPLCFSK